MENQQHSHSTFTCPMHPEVTGKPGDKCPKCGMDLVPAPGKKSAGVAVSLRSSPQSMEAGTPARLAFTFQENNRRVPLDTSHEKKLHLMIVDENLSWFRHLHPEEQADGSYTITVTFPAGGKYFLFTDFKRRGAAAAVDKKEITVKGDPGISPIGFSTKLVSVTDGYTVTLENGNDFKTSRPQALQVSVEKDGRRLTESDIEPYLGATAHIAMISKDDKDFLHIHPLAGKHFPIYAETRIKKEGIYRIWVEFQTKGKVHTADFTVHVAAGKEAGAGQAHHHGK